MFSAVQMYVEHDHRLINQIKVDGGSTPLYAAASLDHCDILCYLAATVCLLTMISMVNSKTTLFLQETCELDKKAYNGWSALQTACYDGNIRSIECLVGYGADPQAADFDGTTPLHFVLAMKNMKPLSERTPHLNKVKQPVNFVGCKCHYAIMYRSVSMCRELTTVFRMSLSTSLWPVSWSVKEPVWRQRQWMGSSHLLSVHQNTTRY